MGRIQSYPGPPGQVLFFLVVLVCRLWIAKHGVMMAVGHVLAQGERLEWWTVSQDLGSFVIIYHCWLGNILCGIQILCIVRHLCR